MNLLVLLAFLLASWFVLSGYFSLFFILLGIMSCLFVVLVNKKLTERLGRIPSILSVFYALPLYVIWLTKEVVTSSIFVTLKVWQLNPDINPGVSWLSTSIKDDIGLTIFANSITLTPGTVAMTVKSQGMIEVHCLNRSLMDSLREGPMDKKIVKIVHNKNAWRS